MNKLIRAGPLILLLGLSAGGIARAGPSPPVNTKVLNVASLRYDGGALSSNPATFTVGQVYGVELKNKEGEEIIIKPYGNSVFWEYEAKNTGNGREPVSTGYEIIEEEGSFTISFVQTKDGTESIQNPFELEKDQSFSFFLKITPNKNPHLLKIKILAETIRDGSPGGNDISEDKPIITITAKPVIISVYPSPGEVVKKDIAPRVVFDEDIKEPNLSMKMWRIIKKMTLSEDRVSVSGSVYKDGKTMEFKPDEALLPLTTYCVEVLGNDEVLYSWQFTTMADDLNSAIAYPNPFDLTRYDKITIGPLPLGTMVKLYTLSGFLVRTLQEREGRVIWDG
ncbi:MAG: Ig-like domain-containing protein, partial [bacterium]